ncbi:leucyl aminopeptidase [Kitasatospora viridis]|uniref:Probable cytosol aminopeptidase n=1 Tax=Kitasatospora viridis TaxID=281105 RepID=A0A561UMK7_9ACTN|nr:leucyl aminopeptidase [Kitasatospora viridis]TWG00590.1 leucyl aminopeptidase [Kitasatospora viridis]
MTELRVVGADASALPADCVVIGAVRGPDGPVPAPGGAAVEAAFCGELASMLGDLGMTGAEGEVVALPAPAGCAARVVRVVGLGPAGSDGLVGAEALRRAAGAAARALAGTGTAVLALPVDGATQAEAVALGALLGAYDFGVYRTGREHRPPVRELVLAVPADRQARAAAGAQRGTVIAQELNRCRDLVNTPANDLYPESFAGIVEKVGAEHGLAVQVLDEPALAAGGFGGILGVGQGSARPPRLVRIAYEHPAATVTLALVGKGITYDSGGISLKPVGFNEIMKRDMSGAAAVLAAVVAAARLGLPVNITGWLAMAENMPSGSALRPGDVLRMYGGRTVEVVNTDAEGRLVLADALVRAGEERPDAIVDVATLTGAMRIALGNRLFAVLSDDDAFRDRVVAAARAGGEQAWPMPLPPELLDGLRSQVADLANSGERMGGGLAAGLFLKEFVPAGTRWAHLDIAGPAFNEGAAHGYTPAGGTGAAVRTLVQLARELAEGSV